MTTLMQRMREDLVRRNYAESTIRSYLHTLEDFRRYAQRRLDHLGPDDIGPMRIGVPLSAAELASRCSFFDSS